MYKRVAIIGYKLGSQSVRGLSTLLKQKLKIPVLRVSKLSTKYQPRWSDYIINWGCSTQWDFITQDKKDGHTLSVNKLEFFKTIKAWNNCPDFEKINIPEWTTDKKTAIAWNTTYLARTVLNGHSGKGIFICEPNDEVLPHAPLYVQYKKKRHEYRVHFFRDSAGVYSIIDITQKKKRKGAENLDTKIRNHQNGWVYAREGITEPADLRDQALRAATAVGLKFGAVDLIWNEKEDKSYVLEINTAPGLTGTTLECYTNAFVKDITQ